MDWIKCITSRLLHAARHEAGITLIETLFAIAIFGIVSTSLIGVLTSATAADGLSRQRSIAHQLAQQQVEYVRQLNYSVVGLQGGNPNGVVLSTSTKRVMGLWYTLTTSIGWVNDPVPATFATAANYKRVRVIVKRNTDNKELARAYAYVSSNKQADYGGINNAVINAQVLDNVLNVPLAGATVALSNGPSPTATVSDTTDEQGKVTFAAMTPNATPNAAGSYYDIMVSLTGYYMLREDLPPGCNSLQSCTTPTAANNKAEDAPAHISLAASEQTNTTGEAFKIYKPSTINVHLFNANGTPYTGAATVIIGQLSPRSAQEYTFSGGNLTVGPGQTSPYDMICGPISGVCDYPVSGIYYMVGARTSTNLFAPVQTQFVPDSGTYPANPVSTFNLTLGSSALAPKACTITVKTSSGTAVSGARVDAVDGSLDPVGSYGTGTTDINGKVILNLPVGTDWDVHAYSGIKSGLLADRQVPSSGSCPGSTSSSSKMYLTVTVA